MNEAKSLIQKIFQISDDVRYVAIYADGTLISELRADRKEASGSDSDRYEELIVNPTLLLLAKQRGDIDCGGCQFVLVRYGNFFQFVKPISNGHLSVCIESFANPIAISQEIDALMEKPC